MIAKIVISLLSGLFLDVFGVQLGQLIFPLFMLLSGGLLII